MKEFLKWHYSEFCKELSGDDETKQSIYDAIYACEDNQAERDAQYKVWAYQQSRINELEINLRTGNRLLHSKDEAIESFIKSKTALKAEIETLKNNLSNALGEIEINKKNLKDRFTAFQLVREEADNLKKCIVKALDICSDSGVLGSVLAVKVEQALQEGLND